MRVALLAMGSRGDIEPFLALGEELSGRGHDVVLGTHREFEELVAGAGLRFAPLAGSPREALTDPEGQRMLRTRNPLALSRRIGRLVGPVLEEAWAPALRACAGADVVVFATLAMVGLNIADHLGVPAVAAHLQPATPTSELPAVSLPSLRPPPAVLNRASWTVSETVSWRAFRPVLNRQRARVGLPALPGMRPSRLPVGSRPLTLYGFSSTVVPLPADWPSDVHVTGYWFRALDREWTPPEPLSAFLAAGAPPVYLGFGSMPDADPAGLAAMLVDGARPAGQRMVLHSGWSRLRSAGGDRLLGDDVCVVDEVPHRWLFPRMGAIVHHGGAGTTAAALLAGVPAVVVPLFADQFFWGRRVYDLGAGPPPIARERLSAGTLERALRQAVSERHRVRATVVSRLLAAECGPRAAGELIEVAGSISG